ncbi:multiple sugar transport system substrate-binding protein [Crossiella equi]|uniref:Multiple sugar transport system substrate-binding protein n=1 Tax=Crossiella equi TaxID=130796 RepID=A0ABS5AAP6_9PSEU|nr:extracellular solute-binding protein [Crossiella equi]MBP2473651.1 multiple sugar transport system substrate-binding protein [Crossiella equi]
MRRMATPVVVVALLGLLAGCLGVPQRTEPSRNADATEFSLTVTMNAVPGGKNSARAQWVDEWVIPRFVEAQRAKGRKATVRFQGNGAGDEDYKTKVALDLKTGAGADLISVDGIWVGEFAEAGQLRPLDEMFGGDKVAAWDGWTQIPQAVQGLGSFQGQRYGVPEGTDGRVLFFNKKLFAQAGLPQDWQPRGWTDVLDAAAALRALPGVTPLQLNAGTAMGEATTMQGVLPLLESAGEPLYRDGKWYAGPALGEVLDLYAKVYRERLGDPLLQQEAKGRDKSFALFAENKLGILLESDYLWRGVVEPTKGVARMADRDTAVGWAMIPARAPGVGGRDFVSMSGGGVLVPNPSSRYPQQAWELLQFMSSAEAVKAKLGGAAQITQRTDVNNEVLAGDPLLSFVAKRVLAVTHYRPGIAGYPRVSAALQQATADVVAGRSAAQALAAYRAALAKIVGEANVDAG